MKSKAILFITILVGTLAVAQERTPPPSDGGPGQEGHRMMMRMHGPGGEMGMGGWWKNSELAKQLNLTDQQKQQLEKTYTDYRLQLIDQRAAVEREEVKLQPLMDADQIDKNKVSAQLDSLIAARSRLEKTSAMMHVAMREILTPDQWKQLQSMHMRHREGRGMGEGHGEGRGMGDAPRERNMRRGTPPPAAAPPGTPPPPATPNQNE